MMSEERFIPLPHYMELPHEEMIRRSAAFYADIRRRRTVRNFSERPVPREIIENCLLAAGTAPSGANIQPWYFVAVSDPETKRVIRLAAEEEEKEFYSRRAPRTWLETLEPFGVNWQKPYLETAPYLIAIFAQSIGIEEGGERKKHYYVQESVGIATGILITAVHQAGLVSLTHTPSPMNFLNKILGRPTSERPFLLLIVGYPGDGALVPDITKKSLDEIATFI
jgi:nitroreductase